jgi:hypothetical protein
LIESWRVEGVFRGGVERAWRGIGRGVSGASWQVVESIWRELKRVAREIWSGGWDTGGEDIPPKSIPNCL